MEKRHLNRRVSAGFILLMGLAVACRTGGEQVGGQESGHPVIPDTGRRICPERVRFRIGGLPSERTSAVRYPGNHQRRGCGCDEGS